MLSGVLAGLGTGAVYAATINGTDGNDVLDGTSSQDFIYANGGNDEVSGYGGSDYIEGNPGADDLQGGAEFDAIYGGNGAATVYGKQGDDSLIGGNGADYIYGGIGTDTLNGHGDGGAVDWLYGDDGSDQCFLVFTPRPSGQLRDASLPVRVISWAVGVGSGWGFSSGARWNRGRRERPTTGAPTSVASSDA